MPDFSSTIPDVHHKVSSGFADTILQTQREKLFSGLMRLHYPSGENLVFSFLEGVQQALYRVRHQTMEVIPRQFWAQTLDRADASIGFLSMSVEALRFMRVAHEAPVTTVDSKQFLVSELAASAGKWAAEPSPSIIHVQRDAINKLYLVAGFSTPVVEELTFLDGHAGFSISDAAFPNSLPQGEYQVTRYLSDQQNPIWQEYELRFAFNPLMRMLIIRFSELAGRILTERLCEQLSNWIKDGGWNIQVNTNGVVHHHYFESLEEARMSYLEIIRSFNNLASPAIGPRMTTGLARDILLKLNPYHRTLLQRHIYNAYGQESMAAQAGGR